MCELFPNILVTIVITLIFVIGNLVVCLWMSRLEEENCNKLSCRVIHILTISYAIFNIGLGVLAIIVPIVIKLICVLFV